MAARANPPPWRPGPVSGCGWLFAQSPFGVMYHSARAPGKGTCPPRKASEPAKPLRGAKREKVRRRRGKGKRNLAFTASGRHVAAFRLAIYPLEQPGEHAPRTDLVKAVHP